MSNCLRQLSRDYAQGQLSFEDYREQRKQLLDDIADGAALVPFVVPTPPSMAPSPQPEFKTREDTLEIRKPARGLPLPAIAAAVVALVAVGGYFALSGGDGRPTPQPPTAATPAAGSDARKLVEDFIDRKDWQAPAVDEFKASWLAADTGQRLEIEQSPLFRHLADATHAQIMEEQALAGLSNSMDALTQQRRLIDFANAMGFNDPRFAAMDQSVTEKIAAAEQAATAAAAPPAPPAAAATAPEPAAPVVPPPAATPAPEQPAAAIEVADATPAAPVTAADTPAADETAPSTDTPVVTEVVAAADAPTTPEVAPVPAPAEPAAPPAGETPPATTTTTTEAPPAASEPPDDTAATAEAKAADGEGKAQGTTKGKKSLACRAELAKQRKPLCRDALTVGDLGPMMVVLPGGEFSMGGDAPHAQPAHRVNIAAPFAIAMHEVSRGEFEAYCKATGRTCPNQPWSGAEYPVVNVSWNDAASYAEWLSNASGKKYRLPSDAEWEYGARAGTSSRYPFGDELLPTHARFSYQGTVDSPLPRSDKTINRNGFKLYHMVGNVREWVQDDWHDGYNGAPGDGAAWAGGGGKVVRGGSYKDRAEALQSAARESASADSADAFTGFSVVQEVPVTTSGASPARREPPAWIAAQGQNQFTLQLFAVQKLDRVEGIVAAHPELELMILPIPDPKTPYRVYFGIYDNAEAAKAAFAALPADVVAQVKKPIVKSFAELQRILAQH